MTNPSLAPCTQYTIKHRYKLHTMQSLTLQYSAQLHTSSPHALHRDTEIEQNQNLLEGLSNTSPLHNTKRESAIHSINHEPLTLPQYIISVQGIRACGVTKSSFIIVYTIKPYGNHKTIGGIMSASVKNSSQERIAETTCNIFAYLQQRTQR